MSYTSDMEDELAGEIGRIQGVVFVDDEGNPIKPIPSKQCRECGTEEGTFWSALQFWPTGGWARWHCPNGHTWEVMA